MASASWFKLTRQAVGGLDRHFDKEKRMTLTHANQDIDKRLTESKNYYLGVDGYRKGVSTLYHRIDEVDAISPPERVTKDRIVACMIETKCPKVITDAGRSREFFEKVFQLEKMYFGVENVAVGCVHGDEVHEYHEMVNGVDTVKTSLEHMHTLVATYAEWDKKEKQYVRDDVGNIVRDENGKWTPKLDENGKQIVEVVHRQGINGKNFETRARLKEFNNLLDTMCHEEFGISYNTGEEAKHKTVEQLKEQGQAYQEYLNQKTELEHLILVKEQDARHLDEQKALKALIIKAQEAKIYQNASKIKSGNENMWKEIEKSRKNIEREREEKTR